MRILHLLLGLYLIILLARAITSWFPPPRPGTPYASITAMLRDLTEPVIGPLRRVIPPAGMFDISFTVAFFVVFILFNLTS